MNIIQMAAVTCVIAVIALGCALMYTGRIGVRRAVRSTAQARHVLETLTEQAADAQRAALTTEVGGGAARFSAALPGDLPGDAEARMSERTRRRDQLLDAAIPGLLAAGIGIHDWLTPDHAAVGALEHMTGTDITTAFDFHRAFANGDYQWWTEGSLVAWRGHVGEHQIADQVDSWAGTGFVRMPEASNYAGADLSMFGEDFQVKFVEKFSSIDNKHGDILIVPEDTTGVPDDALHIDFSQPFDPALLEGHDVIIAEGLTLGGAEDTWAEATGVAAGGFDLDALGDAGLGAALPGAGALIRVAASGYRRRSALADPSLRNKASKLLARDAAYGVGGATVGGTVGTAIGAGVDILALGTTAGGGMFLGGVVGTAVGGMFGAGKSRETDRRQLALAREAVDGALTRYGATVESVTAETQRSWREFVSQIDREAAANAKAATRQLSRARAVAQRDLDELATITTDETAVFVDTIDTVANSNWRTWSGRDKHLAGQLRARIETADRTPTNTERVLLDVLRVPSTEPTITAWLEDRLLRRSTILGALDAHNSVRASLAMNQRAHAFARLGQYRTELRAFAAKQLKKPARAVEKATEAFKQELKLRG